MHERADETTPGATLRRRGGRAGRWILGGLVAAWAGCVLIGSWALTDYDFRPGAGAASPGAWPAGAGVELAAGRPTLLFFAHARCPCTRASLSELELVMARCRDRVDARVLLYQPRDGSEESTGLWKQASRIPGVSVAWDEGGAKARAFGATTSGHVALYDTAGRLLFAGGITASRGHSGDNAGRSAVVAAVEANTPTAAGTPVFGCALLASKTRADRP